MKKFKLSVPASQIELAQEVIESQVGDSVTVENGLIIFTSDVLEEMIFDFLKCESVDFVVLGITNFTSMYEASYRGGYIRR
jgi:hypothetical protein